MGQNEHRGKKKSVSYTRYVEIEVYNKIIKMEQGKIITVSSLNSVSFDTILLVFGVLKFRLNISLVFNSNILINTITWCWCRATDEGLLTERDNRLAHILIFSPT